MTDRYACTQLGLHNVRHFWPWPCPSFLVMVLKLYYFWNKGYPNRTLGGGGGGGGGWRATNKILWRSGIPTAPSPRYVIFSCDDNLSCNLRVSSSAQISCHSCFLDTFLYHVIASQALQSAASDVVQVQIAVVYVPA
jgi:hypothetical protein